MRARLNVLGLSIRDLARLSGVGRGTIYRWLAGGRTYRAQLLALENVLGITVAP